MFFLRAMRNRGVEIFMPLDVDWPKLDLITLLSDSGIKNYDTLMTLIELQTRSENRSVSPLIANGFWTAQYVKHGFNKLEAFRKSSEQVYKFETDVKRQLITELLVKLTSDRYFNLSLAKPTLNNYLIDPNYARLKQSSAFLVALIDYVAKDSANEEVNLSDDEKATKTKTSVSLELDELVPCEIYNYLFDETFHADLKIQHALKYSILAIFLTSSIESSIISHKFLLKYLEELKKLKNWRSTASWLLEILQRFAQVVSGLEENQKDLPWDVRWFRDISRLFNRYLEDSANKTLILLKYLLHCKSDEVPFAIDSKEMTVAQFSKSVQEGKLFTFCFNSFHTNI